MLILSTLIPIFVVIFIGFAARRKGFIPADFLGPANRLVFYIAIPAMVFRAIAVTSFHDHFHLAVLGGILGAISLTFILAWLGSGHGRWKGPARATFIQSSIHGNLGYIGLAVAYYFLGDTGLAHASILSGFLMIIHNVLSVVGLSVFGQGRQKKNLGALLRNILINPVILSSGAGILYSVLNIPLPVIVERSLGILGRLALPMALLLIGASLSVQRIWARKGPLLGAALLKLLIMPALGITAFSLGGLAPETYLPGLILLACPSATVIYVIAGELGGDTDLAAAAVSGSTLASALTLALWLHVGMG